MSSSARRKAKAAARAKGKKAKKAARLAKYKARCLHREVVRLCEPIRLYRDGDPTPEIRRGVPCVKCLFCNRGWSVGDYMARKRDGRL
jgi:hypothetical protein